MRRTALAWPREGLDALSDAARTGNLFWRENGVITGKKSITFLDPSVTALYAIQRTRVMGSIMTEKRSKTLGDVIRGARVAAKKGLREFSRDVGIAPSYQSDIENDRRVPAEDVLKRIADMLGLKFDELMALAGRVGEEAERYLRRSPETGKLLRKISEKNLSESAVRKLSEKADEFDDKDEKKEGLS